MWISMCAYIRLNDKCCRLKFIAFNVFISGISIPNNIFNTLKSHTHWTVQKIGNFKKFNTSLTNEYKRFLLKNINKWEKEQKFNGVICQNIQDITVV